MTTATARQTLTTARPPTATKLPCFSFAAYAKNLIDHLKSLSIPVLTGLTDPEFTSIESTFHFSFPPDLRSILQEGLPIAPYFPNWRSSSLQQLQILLNLPTLNLSKNISQNNFWVDSWGDKPQDNKKAIDMAKGFLDKAPVLVPIYRNCYISSTPNAAGNPVFYVDDGHVRVLSFDLTRFFQEVDFSQIGISKKENVSLNVPAWAATEPRRIQFWTEVAERGRRVIAREPTRGWWSDEDLHKCQLRDCLEWVFWRLRDGGWKEEEVRDMMMMSGCDRERDKDGCGTQFDREDVGWHVRVWSLDLLRAGWSKEDVVYSLNIEERGDENGTSATDFDGSSFLDLKVQLSKSSSRKDDGHQVTRGNSVGTFSVIRERGQKFKSGIKWDDKKSFAYKLRPPKFQKGKTGSNHS